MLTGRSRMSTWIPVPLSAVRFAYVHSTVREFSLQVVTQRHLLLTRLFTRPIWVYGWWGGVWSQFMVT